MTMMSDETLSQEEIEALLSGANLDELTSDAEEEHVNEEYMSELELDTIGEVANISFGSSATALSALLGQKVEITTPRIRVVDQTEFEEEFALPYVAVKVEYTQGLKGMNLFVIKQTDAAIIADLMLGGDGTSPNEEMSEIHLSAVQEAMNQMMGSAATSMSTVFNMKVDISPPSIDLMNIPEDKGVDNIPESELIIKVAFTLKVGDLIDSEIMQILPFEFGKKIVGKLLNGESHEETAATAVEEPPVPAAPQQQAPPVMPTTQPSYAEEVVQQPQMTQRQAPMKQKPQVPVQQAQFASFDAPQLNSSEAQNLDLLLDIPLNVTVELGRTKRSVQEIIEMSSGSIIELDKLAGEPVDILVNHRLIANGEVVVIDENFGVRITDILSPAERINNLR